MIGYCVCVCVCVWCVKLNYKRTLCLISPRLFLTAVCHPPTIKIARARVWLIVQARASAVYNNDTDCRLRRGVRRSWVCVDPGANAPDISVQPLQYDMLTCAAAV